MKVLVPVAVQDNDGERTYPELFQNDRTARMMS